jgi:uncharacterized protein YggE
MSSNAQTTPYVATDGTLLNISAQGEAKRVPDIATMSTGVVTRAPDANAAMRANAEQMAKVVAAIKAAGIADKDVQTSGINLNPSLPVPREPAAHDSPATRPQHGKHCCPRHRQARQDPRHARVRSAPTRSTAQLRRRQEGRGAGRGPPQGVASAQARADMYAKTLGMKVRRIVSISESGRFAPPMPMARGMAMKAESRIPRCRPARTH